MRVLCKRPLMWYYLNVGPQTPSKKDPSLANLQHSQACRVQLLFMHVLPAPCLWLDGKPKKGYSFPQLAANKVSCFLRNANSCLRTCISIESPAHTGLAREPVLQNKLSPLLYQADPNKRNREGSMKAYLYLILGWGCYRRGYGDNNMSQSFQKPSILEAWSCLIMV